MDPKSSSKEVQLKRLFIIVVFILSIFLNASTNVSEDLYKKIDALYAPSNNPDIPGGFAVALVKDEKVIFKKTYGYANNEHDIPFTSSTIFDFASLAKQFTGMAAAMLIEQEKLSMEDNIKKYLPWIPACYSTIMVKHLLYHTSGIRDWVGLVKLSGRYSSDVITDEFLKKLVEIQKELNFAPGDQYRYSNTNYFLLARIISQITGMSFAKWTRENLFKPLNMNDTFFLDDYSRIIKNRAAAYKRNKEGQYVNHPSQLSSYGSSSLYSTLDDMIKWAINYEQKKLGCQKVWDLMFKEGVLNDGTQTGQGLGFSFGDYRGHSRFGFGGSWAGYLCDVSHFPTHKLSYILMINRDPSGVNVYSKIYDLLFGLKPPSQIQTTKSIEKIKKINIPAGKLDDYTGTFYSLKNSLTMRLERKGNELFLHLPWQKDIKGIPQAEDQFYFPALSLSCRFERTHSNEVYRMVFILKNRLSPYKKVYDNVARWSDTKDLTGTYTCPELKTEYEIILDKGRLVLTHLHNQDVWLKRVDQDFYISDQWWLSKVHFVRDKQNRVKGFLLTADSDQIQNLRFIREAVTVLDFLTF
jgi:CubicO group peptidase (beta-lactamase class C family)